MKIVNPLLTDRIQLVFHHDLIEQYICVTNIWFGQNNTRINFHGFKYEAPFSLHSRNICALYKVEEDDDTLIIFHYHAYTVENWYKVEEWLNEKLEVDLRINEAKEVKALRRDSLPGYTILKKEEIVTTLPYILNH